MNLHEFMHNYKAKNANNLSKQLLLMHRDGVSQKFIVVES